MARILLVYGTREGQTARIAEDIAITLEADGHEVDVRNLGRDRPPSVDAYDAVLIGASVHSGAYEREVRRWVKTHHGELAKRPNVFFSVSLTSVQHDTQSNAKIEEVVERFTRQTSWQPQLIGRFGGKVAYSQYNWFIKRVIRRIVRVETEGQYQDMSRDYDLTDYDEVTAFAKTFADAVRVADLVSR